MVRSAIRFAAALLFVVSLYASSALAGPPLICHTFDIGSAKSLPWISEGWSLTGSESYNVNNLVADTVAILDADPSVLVHMETLRRATLYAEKDPPAAKRLLVTLVSRSNAAVDTPAAALASFDAGYLAEVIKQYALIDKAASNPAHNFDGYALVKKAIQLSGNNPQMEFAAALITLSGPADEHVAHTQKAIAGAPSDALLLRNLGNHFMSPQTETMAQMITRNSNVKVAQQ
jgi:hypothetical protein